MVMMVGVSIAALAACIFVLAVCAMVTSYRLTQTVSLLGDAVDALQELVRLRHMGNLPHKRLAERVMEAHRQHVERQKA